MTIDWSEVWRFAWPILKEMLVALLMALLALLGYDKYVPSRLARRSDAPSAGSFASGLDLRLRTIAQALSTRRSAVPDDPGQRIADNQAALERQLIRGDRPPPEQILGGSMLEEGPPLPPGIVEGGMELTRPQVEGGVPSALARLVGPLEQARARPDLPEIAQRMATREASRLGVEERQRRELARL
ncbi:MAG TPA: hypothetical protein PLN42_06775, partial [Anaerolineae bacterium]|nr:hypothetical protein [Anaerolineae bacterium]